MDAYAAQYPPAPTYAPYSGPQGQPISSPPIYTPGPPPVAAPGGGVAPWAQPQKQRTGLKVGLGCLVAVVLVVTLLGGGGYFLIKKLSSKSGSTTNHGSGTPGTSTTAGTGSTPGSGSTPGGTQAGTQTLDNINRQAIYAGANFTILSAKEAASLPDRQESDPNLYALEVQVKESNQTTRTVVAPFIAIDPNGNTYQLYIFAPTSFQFWPANSVGSGALLFDVPKGSKVGDFIIQMGSPMDLPVTVPLTGNYDPNQWQPVTHPINQTINYENGNIQYIVTQVVVTTWTPGYQAPKGMRILEMYLRVTNNTAIPINAGDGVPPVYLLVFPDGTRSQPTVIYGPSIDAGVAGGESKDVGYDPFLIPPTPTPGLQMVFLFADGSVAGKVDMGTF
jgi:hypothetical protein